MKGATLGRAGQLQARRVSIHAPVKGATGKHMAYYEEAYKFQSTRP